MLRKLKAIAAAGITACTLCACDGPDDGYTLSKVATSAMSSELANVHNLKTAAFCYETNPVTSVQEPWLTVEFADGSAENFAIKDGGNKVLLDWQFTKATWEEPRSGTNYHFGEKGCFATYDDENPYFHFVPGRRYRTMVEVKESIASVKPYGAIEGDLKLATRALITALADHDKRYVEPINTY
jgi:hypothetical protein